MLCMGVSMGMRVKGAEARREVSRPSALAQK